MKKVYHWSMNTVIDNIEDDEPIENIIDRIINHPDWLKYDLGHSAIKKYFAETFTQITFSRYPDLETSFYVIKKLK